MHVLPEFLTMVRRRLLAIWDRFSVMPRNFLWSERCNMCLSVYLSMTSFRWLADFPARCADLV